VFLPPPSASQAYAPLWLKVLVIVMGLLIVAGFVVIAAEIARRMSSASAPAAPTTGFAKDIALPSGAQVVSVSAAGERIAVHVKAVDGRSTLYIVDPRSGALLGTVDFPPGAAR
jgi:hypothetical protein